MGGEIASAGHWKDRQPSSHARCVGNAACVDNTAGGGKKKSEILQSCLFLCILPCINFATGFYFIVCGNVVYRKVTRLFCCYDGSGDRPAGPSLQLCFPAWLFYS